MTDVRDYRQTVRVARSAAPIDGGSTRMDYGGTAIANAQQRDYRQILRIAGYRVVETTSMYMFPQGKADALQVLYALRLRVVNAVALPTPEAKVWSGTGWVSEPVRLWSGTTFADAIAMRVWNGTSFVEVGR